MPYLIYEVRWMAKINYKFNEKNLIDDLQNYIDKTYDGHYSKNKFQSTEFIIDCGHGMGFALGNVLKYAQRYGKKEGYNRADIMKLLHYALIALHNHDLEKKLMVIHIVTNNKRKYMYLQKVQVLCK